MNALLQDLEGTKYDGKIKIVGFPCNQFKHQEPARNTTELLNGLRYVRPGEGYIPAFDLMNKSDVNGPKENPVYTYLKSTCRIPSAAKFRPRVSFWEPIRPSDIVWNFEKFVIDAAGRPLFRFLSPVEPLDVKEIMMQVSDNGKDDGKTVNGEQRYCRPSPEHGEKVQTSVLIKTELSWHRRLQLFRRERDLLFTAEYEE
ncbi:hypothetical protein FSP39_007613 [Pinctada imbricata]|uniref:Glutathione peroxidase n=1 Tax=Pinctada imbricata TaxID=66713 RepID=A0AA88Y2P1_PINIB|nr:hypothetical protein FSP39_007613 [Pinctada imbricata]